MRRTFGTRESGKEYRHREGAYAVAFDGLGRVALVEAPAARTKERRLFLPGGGIEPGESREDCVRRECLEETGLAARVGAYLCTGDEYVSPLVTVDRCYLHVTGHCYRTVLDEKLQEPIEADHVLVWADPETCAEKMFLRYQAWAVETAWREVRREHQTAEGD